MRYPFDESERIARKLNADAIVASPQEQQTLTYRYPTYHQPPHLAYLAKFFVFSLILAVAFA
ncbi:hypothetical protein B0H12DRAFT_1154686 [Mycena haematopus]|nr:hypothetical protein B0H12DRAFT_1154686 [Mycena haematopus]